MSDNDGGDCRYQFLGMDNRDDVINDTGRLFAGDVLIADIDVDWANCRNFFALFAEMHFRRD